MTEIHMHQAVKKYSRVVNIGFQRVTIYRARNVIWFLIDAFIIIVMPFVWLAIYDGRPEIAGISVSEMITYFVGVAVLRVAVSSHLEERMRFEIRDGLFSNLVSKPLNYFWYVTFREVGWRIGYSLTFIPVLFLALYLFNANVVVNTDPTQALLTLAAMFLAVLLFSTLNFIVGTSALFLVESNALADFFWLAYSVFSGVLAPLVFFPSWFQSLAHLMPFKYLISFPLTLYLGELTRPEIISGFVYQVAWIGLTGLIAYALYKIGLRKFEGVGI